MKIIVFSTGSRCEYLLKLNKYAFELNEIVAFADNDKKKHGSLFHGKKIISPQEIKNYEYDIIYIANILYYDEIFSQLTDGLGIDADKVKSEDYLQIWFSKREHKRHYQRLLQNSDLEEKDNSDIEMCKMVVYTAIFGGYDHLKDPEFVDKNIDYVCYTDNPDLKSNIWEVIYVPEPLVKDSPRRSAKIYKILPHEYFPEYDVSVWVDGTATVRGDLRDYAKKYMRYSDIVFCPHIWNDCIYQEAAYTFENRPFEELDRLEKQMDMYKKQGMPKHNGIISGGFIVRRHNRSEIERSMVDWWNEIEKYSTQDQISFAYIAWKNGLIYDVSDLWIYDNPYVIFSEHSAFGIIKDARPQPSQI